MNTQAYIDLSTQIRNNVAAIQEIDIYNRQYEDPEYHETYAYPAVYIEFSPNEWYDNNDDSQQGLGGFIIHVVVGLVTANTRNIDQQGGASQTAALAPFSIFQGVHQALNRFIPTGFQTPLERVADYPDHNYSEVMVVKMKYTAIALDNGTSVYNNDDWVQRELTDIIPDVTI